MAFTAYSPQQNSSPQSGFTPYTPQASTPTPDAPKQSFGESIWSGLAGGATAATNAIGLHGAVDTVGSELANIGNDFNPTISVSQKLQTSQYLQHPNPEQAIGAGLQIGSALAAPAIAPEGVAATIGAGAGIGAAQSGGAAMTQKASAGEVAKQAGIGGAIGGVTAGAVAGLGHLIGSAGDKIMTSVIKPSRADVADGFNVQTLKDFNLGGSLSTTLDKTQSALGDLTTQLKQKLASSDASINLSDIVDQTAKELTDSSKLKGFGANAKILNTLEQLKNEAQIVSENGALSIPDAQVVKQAAGSFGAWQYGKVDPESKASEIVYNTFYNKLKTAIEQNSPEGVKEINQQLSKLIPVQNAVLRRMPVAERSGLISLNDMIGLVGSTAHPAALGPTLLNLVSKSGAAGSLLSKLGPAASRLAVPAAAIGSQATQTQDTGTSVSQ